MFDYATNKRELSARIDRIGRRITPDNAERRMSAAQLRRRRGRNIMTDDVWEYRALAGGALIAEVSYSWFMQAPLYGLTVFCVGELAHDAPEWDFSLSGCYHTHNEVVSRLHMLNEGGRERIAALAAAAA